MGSKSVVKKIIPKSVKRYIKKNVSDTPKSVEYIVRESDKERFEGQRIMVTGGTGAIGSAICQRLLAEGAVVGICARNKNKLSEVKERFVKENIANDNNCYTIIMDVTDENSIKKAVDEFVEKTGGLEGFVNNAGGGARGESKPLYLQDIEIIDRVLDTNLRGSILCAREAAKVMVERKCGKIINMSSVMGMNGKATMVDYSASKAGILGLTKSLALELGEFGITVNAISPGMVNQIPFDKGMAERRSDKNVIGRFGYTDEVADLAAFILSDNADYITGHNFVIDGGRSLGLFGDK